MGQYTIYQIMNYDPPLNPKYLAVGKRCMRNPVGSSKNRYVT